MYKIYINENRLILCSFDELKTIEKQFEKPYVYRYNGKVKTLPNYIDRLEKRANLGTAIVYSDNYEQLVEDFKSLFIRERAAGGLVVNKKGQFLMMYRRGHLDLPKGKIEKKEKRKAAAIREIKEETGIKNISLRGERLIKTRHTFKNKQNKRVRKISHWYLFDGKGNEFIPQHSEDIEWVKWMTKYAIIESELPIYANVVDVIEAYLSQKSLE